jgi:hypothetical protein
MRSRAATRPGREARAGTRAASGVLFRDRTLNVEHNPVYKHARIRPVLKPEGLGRQQWGN